MPPFVTADADTGSEPPMTGGLADLVSEARKGDRSAFEELVKLTYVDSYTLALRLVGDEEDARDVVQEAYLRAFRGLKRFRGDAQFTTWLYRITANCASPRKRPIPFQARMYASCTTSRASSSSDVSRSARV